jgi:hypothetical protein
VDSVMKKIMGNYSASIVILREAKRSRRIHRLCGFRDYVWNDELGETQ